MLTTDEKKFLDYWEKNRIKETNVFTQLRHGLPIGLGLAILILLNYTTGWYERATMVANSQSTPLVLVLGLVIIVVFWSVFSRRHKWDMNEQRYKELLIKQQKEQAASAVQQDENKSGQ